MKKCAICGKRKDIYDLTRQCCFDCRHKIDAQAEIEKAEKSLKEFKERNNMKYKPSNCDMPLPQGFGKQEGWICPVCGRGVAPWTSFCPCQSDWKITYGTSTDGTYDIHSYLEQTKQMIKEIDSELGLNEMRKDFKYLLEG